MYITAWVFYHWPTPAGGKQVKENSDPDMLHSAMVAILAIR